MSRVPPRPATKADVIDAIARNARVMPAACVGTTLERQAEIETAFLLHFINEPVPGDMDRLRPEQVEHMLKLIAALKTGAGMVKAVAELSPIARELMGLKP